MNDHPPIEKPSVRRPPVKTPRAMFEVGIILTLKIAFIFGLWYFFFGPDKRVEQTPENVASAILDRTAPNPTKENSK